MYPHLHSMCACDKNNSAVRGTTHFTRSRSHKKKKIDLKSRQHFKAVEDPSCLFSDGPQGESPKYNVGIAQFCKLCYLHYVNINTSTIALVVAMVAMYNCQENGCTRPL